MRKILFAAISALSLIAAPTASFARDHNDGWRGGDRHGGWDRGYGGGRYYDRGRHDRGDAVAAGVIGLVLGAAIGSAITSDRQRRDDRRYDDRYYGPPPEQDYRYSGPQQGYYPQGQCFRRELEWDPRTRRNVEVTHPYPC